MANYNAYGHVVDPLARRLIGRARPGCPHHLVRICWWIVGLLVQRLNVQVAVRRRAVGEEVQVLQRQSQLQHVLGAAGVHEHGIS